MNLSDRILSEKHHTHKTTYYFIPFNRVQEQEKLIHGDRSQWLHLGRGMVIEREGT